MRTVSTAEEGSVSQSDSDGAVEAFRTALWTYVTGDPEPRFEPVAFFAGLPSRSRDVCWTADGRYAKGSRGDTGQGLNESGVVI